MTAKVRVSVHTFGCKLNQYESAFMSERLSGKFDVHNDESSADVFLFNSCTVTAEAERKLRQKYRSLRKKNPNSLFVVTGCYSELSSSELIRVGFDAVIKSSDKNMIDVKLLEMFGQDSNSGKNSSAFPRLSSAPAGRTRAYVSIVDGCRNHCTYCRTRLARGTEIKSKPILDVRTELEELVAKGYREIVLTGLNICFYGEDLGSSLLELLSVLDEVEGVWRIRLSSLHPAYVSEELVKYIAGRRRYAQHLHLSLQSGSDRILSLMDRGYTRDDFRSLVSSIWARNHLLGITTDVIVGFPSETEADFLDTCSVISDIGFLKVHVFRYSPRPGTLAAFMQRQVPEEMKKHRARRLIELAKQSSLDYLARNLGQERELLVERADDTRAAGVDECYVTHLVEPVKVGQFVRVVPEEISQEGDEQSGVLRFRSMVVR